MTLFGGVDKQWFASDRVPMPVDAVYDTAYVNSITGETVQLYYFNAGVLTIDAGQVAGTLVVAKMAYSGILDNIGSMIGTDEDTSLTRTTGTVLPIANIKPCPKGAFENPQNRTLFDIAKDLTVGFATGEWCLDHRSGLIIGKKATTGTSDTAAYKVATTTTGGGPSIATTVKVSDGTDVLDVLVQDAAFGTATKGIATFGKYMATPTTYTDGDACPILTDANGRIALSSDIQIGAVEIKDGTSDNRQAVIVDNATATATPTVAMVGAIYKNALDTYDDNDAAPIPTTANGVPIVAITSGASLTPIFNTAANAGFAKVTDGTNTAVVQAAADEAEDEASDSLQTVSAMYGYDSEAAANSRLRAVQVAVDNAGVSATPNVLIAGGIYKNAADTYDDNDAAPLHTDVNGNLKVAISSDIEIGAVEIKDGDSDNRSEVHAPNSAAMAFGLNVIPARYNATPPTITDTYANPLQLDVSGNLKVNSTADIPTTLTGGSKTVTTGGIAEALGTTLATKSIYIRAKASNTSFVCIGDSTVDKTTNQQIVLYSNDAVTIDIADRATVYVDVNVDLEGVDYLCTS